MRLRIWGVTSVPSHPIISIWPMALGSINARQRDRTRHSRQRRPPAAGYVPVQIVP